ncbi:DUF1565 domain-containing protein [Streptomyces sp. NPDC059442]|uniref:right-handed parallel beta-helix repeat-containing protein n=1 Tax=Streptomyces sp. NPDC059442 TaxID=3346830 RepID=UPI0036B142D7
MKRTGVYAVSALLAGSAIPLGLAGTQTAQAASRMYYVSPSGSDTNPGTSPAIPFRTLQKAADSTAPGDTVSVMNGTYKERSADSDVVTITRSGRPGAPITFQAYPGHHTVINPVTALLTAPPLDPLDPGHPSNPGPGSGPAHHPAAITPTGVTAAHAHLPDSRQGRAHEQDRLS